ncbi:hypothetical protein VIGAN_03191400, partial [Vigna angularis var. angularis]
PKKLPTHLRPNDHERVRLPRDRTQLMTEYLNMAKRSISAWSSGQQRILRVLQNSAELRRTPEFTQNSIFSNF